MEGIGIVRRIDNLGRIVIPMEIRRNLKLKEGDPLELYVLGDSITVKKFSAIDSYGEKLATYCDEISKELNITIIATDMDKILVATGKNKNNYLEQPLEKDFKQVMGNRKVNYSKDKSSHIPMFLQDDLSYKEQVLVPIQSKGEVVGSFVGISTTSIDKTALEVMEIFSKLFARILD